MPQHDIRAELAPRDVVARAIDFEMKKHGIDCVHLDISHQPLAFMQEHFPNIYARCLELGIDITKQPIPVVPAAHYTCGGMVTDLHGRTDLVGLHAMGETAYTGLHGANRLASNSLVECMVFARAAAQDILQSFPWRRRPCFPAWDDSRVTDADEAVVISHNWDELRRFMWDYVGIVRTNKRLERAAHRIALLQGEIHEFYAHFHVTRDLLELRNLVQVADLIVRSAQARRESRGLHYSLDYPALEPLHRDTAKAYRLHQGGNDCRRHIVFLAAHSPRVPQTTADGNAQGATGCAPGHQSKPTIGGHPPRKCHVLEGRLPYRR
jgi:L-aspartate oxidase